jgi:hypothetical protein
VPKAPASRKTLSLPRFPLASLHLLRIWVPEVKRDQGAARYDARSAGDVAVSGRRVADSWLARARAGSRVCGACACRHCAEGGTLMYIGIGTVVLIIIIVLVILLIRR